VDSSKFDRRGVHVSCPLRKLDVLITDTGISREARRMVTEAGVSLVLAEVA
jgi:DeoR family ulaG and ulaABCDEF operon transcriptional repressor